MKESIKTGKYLEIIADFGDYVREDNRVALDNFKKDFWKNSPEMYTKYKELVDIIELQKHDHEIDLYDLDESKFHTRKKGLGSIAKRQNELKIENKQFIKDLFLYEAKEGEKDVKIFPTDEDNSKELKLVLNEKLYKKFLEIDKKLDREERKINNPLQNEV